VKGVPGSCPVAAAIKQLDDQGLDRLQTARGCPN
jgi:hypothetical protein